VNGFLVVDKPVGITSHDVVGMVRAVTGVKKVGHTGTLDPFATGVLPLALGAATRLIQYLDEDIKVYEGAVALGQATDTGDPTGQVTAEAPVPIVDDNTIRQLLASFVGTRMQVPPAYSAVKVAGKPLYAYARQGVEVEAKARAVRIDSLELMDRGEDWLFVRLQCGRGTYARVIAEEIGVALGTVAHLRSLRRTRSGPFVDAGSLRLEDLAEIVAGRQDWPAVLRPRRGEERVPWNDRNSVLAGISAHLLPVTRCLTHLPQVEVPPGLRAALVDSGRTTGAAAPELPLDALYLAVCAGEVLAVLRRTPNGAQVERMLAGRPH
jgi:tRNA pseudouridine55 synthase